VREEFGIEGVGEGLVWYPVLNEVTMSVLSDTLFKTKGPSHAMVQHKRGEKEGESRDYFVGAVQGLTRRGSTHLVES
jgi:hypothetical protein